MSLIDRLMAEDRAWDEREARRQGITVEELERKRTERSARLLAERQARPCFGMEREQVRAWMKEHARPDLWVVVRSTAGGLYTYTLDQITEVNARSGRFYTKHAHTYKGGSSWYMSGQSTRDPKGQVDVLIPTPELVEAAAAMTAPVPKPDEVAAARAQAERLFPKRGGRSR